MGLSLLWPLPLWSTGSRRSGSAAMAHGPSHSAACGIFPDRGTNPCPLHRQADSQPLHHQGSPTQNHLCDTLETVRARSSVIRVVPSEAVGELLQASLWLVASCLLPESLHILLLCICVQISPLCKDHLYWIRGTFCSGMTSSQLDYIFKDLISK